MITTCEYTIVNGKIVPVYNDLVHECKCYIDERGYTRLVEDKVFITPGEQVGVTKVAKKKPNYFMVGNGTMNKNKIYSIDLLKEMANSTKAEQYLLLAIKDGINYENEYNPVVKVVGDTSTAKQYIKSGYKSLYERNLVIRVKKSHYMINPNALVPIDYEDAIELWNQVKGGTSE